MGVNVEVNEEVVILLEVNVDVVLEDNVDE